MINGFFLIITLVPVKKIEIAKRNETKPIDCKKKSEITLPLKPKILLMI